MKNLKLAELTKEELQEIIKKITKRLSKEQYEYLQHLITEYTEKQNTADISPQSLMSKAFVMKKCCRLKNGSNRLRTVNYIWIQKNMRTTGTITGIENG